MSKTITIYSPFTGVVLPLEEVSDESFTRKMLGVGMAVIPDGNLVYPPVDGGKLEAFYRSLHAFALAHNNVEILVHVGIDSYEMDGEGFALEIPELQMGDRLDIGKPVLSLDLEMLAEPGSRVTHGDELYRLRIKDGNYA